MQVPGLGTNTGSSLSKAAFSIATTAKGSTASLTPAEDAFTVALAGQHSPCPASQGDTRGVLGVSPLPLYPRWERGGQCPAATPRPAAADFTFLLPKGLDGARVVHHRAVPCRCSAARRLSRPAGCGGREPGGPARPGPGSARPGPARSPRCHGNGRPGPARRAEWRRPPPRQPRGGRMGQAPGPAPSAPAPTSPRSAAPSLENKPGVNTYRNRTSFPQQEMPLHPCNLVCQPLLPVIQLLLCHQIFSHVYKLGLNLATDSFLQKDTMLHT